MNNVIDNEKNIKAFLDALKESENVVFFGGAGVSTESGIPDFRGSDGLYNTKYDYPPETILSHTFFEENPKEFFRFYFDKMIVKNAKPNLTHLKLAELEKKGKVKAVITQNIDGLHQMAGSENVYELHGSVHRNHCTKCGEFYSMEEMIGLYKKSEEHIPLCDCGGIVKPDVVLYEEPLDNSVTEKAVEAIYNADMLIVGGTSLVVYPAAGFVGRFKGEHLVLINKSPTSYDSCADILINCGLGEVFSKI